MLEILQQIGMTPSESKVYVTLLETGKNTATGILTHANLNSGRIYEVLTSLEHKGLVSTIKEGKIKYFIASPPERVLDYLNQKIDAVNEQKTTYEKILPNLKKSYSKTQQEIDVQVFLGAKGQRTAYDILFAESEKEISSRCS